MNKLIQSEIRTLHNFAEECFKAQDAERFVDRFYSDDIIISGHGDGIWKGKNQVLDLVKSLMPLGLVKVAQIETQLISNDVVADFVLNEIKAHDGSGKAEKIKALLTFRKIDGEWRCTADMFTPGRYDAAVSIGEEA